MATAKTEQTIVASLVFQDGAFHKFWRIDVNGRSHTVRYGRDGATGKTETKEFDSEQAARKSADKLIAEKRRKGYVDDAGNCNIVGPNEARMAANTKASATTKAQSKTKAEALTTKQVVTETPGTVAETGVVRHIGLETKDWLLAKFRITESLKRGEPRPFDKEACVKALRKLGAYGPLEDLHLPSALSKEEAHFWLLVMTKNATNARMYKFAASMKKLDADGKIKAEVAWSLMEKESEWHDSMIMLPVANLFSPDEIVKWMLTERKGTNRQRWRENFDLSELMRGFDLWVRPYLAASELKALKKLVAASIDPTAVADESGWFPIAHYLAASLGMHTELLTITSNWRNDRNDEWPYDWPYCLDENTLLVCGLASPELVESEWRRLNLRVSKPEIARALIACTEYSALDLLADEICKVSDRDECKALLKVLAVVNAPEAAEPMLRCKLESKSPNIARDWLDTNVGNAVNGLIDTAGGRGKLAEAAIEYLRSAKRNGLEDVITSALKQASESTSAAKVQAEVLDWEEKVYEPLDLKSTPKWLSKALLKSSASKKKLPSWATANQLPPLIISDRRLNDQQLDIVLQKLVTTKVTDKDELLTLLREKVEKSVRDEFAWKVFQHWQDDGFPSNRKWAMGTIGHLGDDGCVLKLTPMIRSWPGETYHARAVFGLECLRAIGSSLALMQLSGISQKLKFKGLRTIAAKFVDEIAKEKGMTRDDLEDRVVPDCGLDEQGKREFSFGPRSFSFMLGSDLKAMIRDESGKARADLPKPSSKDDAAVAKQTVAEWKLLKKQIKEVAKIQSSRLENAMVTGRRWSQDDFQMLIVQHPLMTHLAQKLIWATFDNKGNVSSTFRVTEERDYADVADKILTLPKDHVVGLIHPLEMIKDDRVAWGQVLHDYEIVAPFAQLSRAVFQLENSEKKSVSLDRFNGLKIAAPALVSALDKTGWIRVLPEDGRLFYEHSKQFPTADVTAVVRYDGLIGMGYIYPDELLTLEEVYFIPGIRQQSSYGQEEENVKKVKLGTVNQIVISEVLADMHVLKSKAQ